MTSLRETNYDLCYKGMRLYRNAIVRAVRQALLAAHGSAWQERLRLDFVHRHERERAPTR